MNKIKEDFILGKAIFIAGLNKSFNYEIFKEFSMHKKRCLNSNMI